MNLESKARINSLISAANATTGKADTDLTSAVGALIAGFGQGGGSGGGGASVSEVTLATSFTNAGACSLILEAMTNHTYTLFVYTGKSTDHNQIYSAVIDKTVEIDGYHQTAYNRYRSGRPAYVGGIGGAYDLIGSVGDTFLMIGGDAP